VDSDEQSQQHADLSRDPKVHRMQI